MRKSTTRRIFAGTFLSIVVFSCLGGCEGRNDKRSPGERLLYTKLAKMRIGMTVAEVDALMTGHPRQESKYHYDSTDKGESHRLSGWEVLYGVRDVTTEGDHALAAYFDKDGKLMKSDIGAIGN